MARRRLARLFVTPTAERNPTEQVADVATLFLTIWWGARPAVMDVLYISVQRPQQATDTEMIDEGILVRYRGKDLVGITILDASTRHS